MLTVTALLLAFLGCDSLRQQTKIVDKPAGVMLRLVEPTTVKAEYLDEHGEKKTGKYLAPSGLWMVSPDFLEEPDSSGGNE